MVSSPLVVLDIETDGLDPTKIWVAVTKSMPEGKRRYTIPLLPLQRP